MNYKDLYRPNFYYDDPKVDLYSKRRGFIKKKVEGIRDQLGFNQGSSQVYVCFQQRGKLLCQYSDIVKKGGELQSIIRMSNITSIEDEVKGKKGHFVLKTGPNEAIHFKCDDVKETAEWVKTIKFFTDYYKNDNKTNEKETITGYIDIDIETKLNLHAEIELDNWDVISSKFNYTGFIKDKGVDVLFENNIMEIMKNRLLVSSAQKETKHKKGASINEPQTPTTPITPRKQLDAFNLNALTSSQYHFVLICQRPINVVDEEFALTDDVILEKGSLPEWMAFNTLYYFHYSARGDITTYKKSLEVS